MTNIRLVSVPCTLFWRATWGSQVVLNMADILTEVMNLYGTGGLTCYWRIRGNVCMYCKTLKAYSNWLKQDTYLINHLNWVHRYTLYWIHLATKHILYCQVRIPKLYKRATARSYSLNWLDDMMTDIQNIRWVGFNLGPPALEASTLPIGYQGGG